MSTADDRLTTAERVLRKRAAAGFILLLLLAVFWPAPVVAVNDVCCGLPLPVDELSFLGREAPSWDVIFWCLAGLFLLVVLQWFDFEWRAFRQPVDLVRSMSLSPLRGRPVAMWLLAAALSIAGVWFLLDSPVTAFAERVNSDSVEDVIRLFNRLGGGMNPPMVVLFFVIVGVASHYPAWVRIGTGMAVAGALAGGAAQLLKLVFARMRPELWHGPFAYSRAGADSFPSGHTVGAFALAGVILFASRSPWLRSVAVLLAVCVAASRILAFRHWASDVVASALLGTFTAWVVARSMEERGHEA